MTWDLILFLFVGPRQCSSQCNAKLPFAIGTKTPCFGPGLTTSTLGSKSFLHLRPRIVNNWELQDVWPTWSDRHTFDLVVWWNVVLQLSHSWVEDDDRNGFLEPCQHSRAPFRLYSYACSTVTLSNCDLSLWLRQEKDDFLLVSDQITRSDPCHSCRTSICDMCVMMLSASIRAEMADTLTSIERSLSIDKRVWT